MVSLRSIKKAKMMMLGISYALNINVVNVWDGKCYNMIEVVII